MRRHRVIRYGIAANWCSLEVVLPDGTSSQPQQADEEQCRLDLKHCSSVEGKSAHQARGAAAIETSLDMADSALWRLSRCCVSTRRAAGLGPLLSAFEVCGRIIGK